MASDIGQKALKISCLQVKPGYEFQVAEEIKEKGKDIKKNNLDDVFDDIFIFKGFGIWDLILVYEQSNFEPLLSKAGPIPGILDTTTFFCFQYRKTARVESVLKEIESFTFFGFIFIKLKITQTASMPDVEEQLFQFIETELKGKCLFFSTLGWNEVIVISAANDLDQIVGKLFKLNFNLEKSGTPSKNITKTYTQLAINHDKLIGFKGYETDISKAEHLLEQSLDNNQIAEEICPTVYIASECSYYYDLINFWRAFNGEYDIQACYGEFDFSIKPKTSISWGTFLSRLLGFRQRFKDELCITHTVFSYKPTWPDLQQDPNSESHNQVINRPYMFSYSELGKNFGSTMATILSNHFYRLNAFIQHPIIGSCFDALKNYPAAIIKDAIEMNREGAGDKVECMARQAAMVLSLGLELRSYGTYGNIQKNYAHFGNLGGGVQRALAAMELLPRHIFRSYKNNWKGFIISQDPKFAHIRDVICVPTEALWKPGMWWALYHETAHILIDRAKWITEEIESVRAFLDTRLQPYKDTAIDLLNEIAAEIIGYELGFFGNFDLFMRLVWNHLIDIAPKQQKTIDHWVYLVRTFCVELYERRFKLPKNGNSIDDNFFNNNDLLYESFIAHVEKTQRIIESLNEQYGGFKSVLKYMKAKAASNAPQFKQLLPFLKYLNQLHEGGKKEDGKGFCPSIDTLSEDSTTQAISSITEGAVYWDSIKHPEAVLYQFFDRDKDDMKVPQNIALILTFWNAAVLFNEDN